MENLEDIQLLKESVEKQFGSKILYAKDCAALSECVYSQTGNKVSETTLKRLWNLVNSSFNPSKYTLNSLCQYLGFADWDDFVSNKNSAEKNVENIEKWELIKQKSRNVSYNSFISIKSRMGIELKNTVHRAFADEMMDNFLKSDKTATAFIAPGGYGKSTIVSSLVNDFFLSENPKCPDDIVWFMDCGILDSINSDDFDIEPFIIRLLGYDEKYSFKEYFDMYPAAKRGRIVLVFDGLNDFSGNIASTKRLINNILRLIAQYKSVTWFKIVLTLRPDLWNYICKTLNDSTEIKSTWFGVEFSTVSSMISNIPPLKMEEVELILKNNGITEVSYFLNLMQEGISNITRIPYFLHLYISLAQSNRKSVSDIDLLREFVSRKITSVDNGDRKLKLIDFLLFSTNYGVDTDVVAKNTVSSLITKFSAEFDELLSFGILYEYKVEDKFLTTTTYIKFSHQILFEFLLANYWLREIGFVDSLFSEVAIFYQSNISLKFQIVTWLIKYSFREGRTDIISNIFTIVENYFSSSEEQSYVTKLINIVGLEMRKYPEIRDEILNYFAKSISGRHFYYMNFCDIDSLNSFFGNALLYFINNSITPEDFLFAYTLKLQQAFFNKDIKSLTDYYSKIELLDIPANSNICYIELMSIQILYYSMREGHIPSSLIDYITKFSSEFYSRFENLDQNFGYRELILIDSLYLTEQWQLVKIVCDIILGDISYVQKNIFNEYFRQLQLIYSISLLKLGYNKKAYLAFESIIRDNRDLFPVCASNYWNMRFCEIAANFNVENFDIYSDYVKKGLAISKYLKFTFFEKRFHQMLNRLKRLR
ncbi:MAG: hypothetical protein MJ211_11445 [Bacteroidales bacterium]|nr:hypothetical protein [Bacteroidales bacterium]